MKKMNLPGFLSTRWAERWCEENGSTKWVYLCVPFRPGERSFFKWRKLIYLCVSFRPGGKSANIKKMGLQNGSTCVFSSDQVRGSHKRPQEKSHASEANGREKAGTLSCTWREWRYLRTIRQPPSSARQITVIRGGRYSHLLLGAWIKSLNR